MHEEYIENCNNNVTKLPFFGLGKILPYLKLFWKNFVFIAVVGLLASADDVIMPLFQKHVLNRFIGERNLDSFGIFIVLYIIAILMSGVLNGLSTLKASSVAMLEGHAMNDPEGRYDIGPAMEVARMQYADQEWNVNTAVQKFGNGTSSLVGDNGKGTYGICTQVADGDGTERVYYFDNFKAYLVDAFDVEEVTGYGNNFNTEKGRVTFTFSKKVDVTTATANGNIVLLDEAGEVVENGIESVTAKDG